ncbi:MAG: hypothetical protein ABSC46_13045 [Candidatus Limnocylindrales bacterium]|jgi:hypothetical protein
MSLRRHSAYPEIARTASAIAGAIRAIGLAAGAAEDDLPAWLAARHEAHAALDRGELLRRRCATKEERAALAVVEFGAMKAEALILVVAAGINAEGAGEKLGVLGKQLEAMAVQLASHEGREP